MTTTRPLAAAAMLGVLAAPAMAAEGEWTSGTSSCRPTLERWLRSHERKFTNGYMQFGAFVAGEVRWDNGVIAEVTVGPALDELGHPAFCVVASRLVARPEQQARAE